MATIEMVRAEAVKRMPFAGRAIMSLQPVASQDVPSAIIADDEWNIYYDIDAVESAHPDDLEPLVTEYCVELFKLLQNHSQRIHHLLPDKDSSNGMYEQIAQQCSNALAYNCISPIINGYRYMDAWMELPGCSNMQNPPSLERMFRIVCANLPPGSFSSPQPQAPSSSTLASKPCGSSSDGQQRPWETEKKQQKRQSRNSEPPSKKKQGNPDAGNAGTSQGLSSPGSPQQPPHTPQPCQSSGAEGHVDTQHLRDQLVKETARNAAAMMHSNGIGDYEGYAINQWCKEELQNTTPQNRSLMSILRHYSSTKAGFNLRSYNGRNRRQQQISAVNNANICLPQDTDPNIDMTIVLDTSGSMTAFACLTGLSHIASTLQSLRINGGCHFYRGDTRPTLMSKHLTRHNVREFYFDSNGGTNMEKVCIRAYQEEIKMGRSPNLMMCVTDGFTNWEYELISEVLPVPFIVAVVARDASDTYEDLFHIVHKSHKIPRDAIWSILTGEVLNAYNDALSC